VTMEEVVVEEDIYIKEKYDGWDDLFVFLGVLIYGAMTYYIFFHRY